MEYIDLHVHSNASDGTLTPSEVVDLAVESHLTAIALTDHDTLSGLPEAMNRAAFHLQNQKALRIIPGTELSVSYKERDIHILGLFIDPGNKEFNKTLTDAVENRDRRNEKMAANLNAAGIDITMDKLREDAGDAVITRAHFAKYMVKCGYVKTNQDAFNRYLNSNSPYYVQREYMDPGTALRLIHTAGGLAVLAHPLLYNYSLEEVEELVVFLVELGLDGIEAIYSSNTGFDEGRMRHLANKYNLVITGGSDFHGANKPAIRLGIGRGNLKIPASLLIDLEERLSARNSL